MRRRIWLALGAGLLAGCGSAEISATHLDGRLPDGSRFLGTQAIYSHDHSGNAQVLVSLDPRACQHLTETELFGQSRLLGLDGGIAPSVFMVLGKGRFLGNDERNVGSDLQGTLDPGQPEANGFGCVRFPDAGFAASADGGVFCTAPIGAIAGKGHLDRNDDPQTADALATGDVTLTFPAGGTFAGSFAAKPCNALHAAGLDCGCTSTDGLELLPLLALLGLRRRKRLA